MVRNWAFDTFMNEVIADHVNDPEIVGGCKTAIANYGLHFALIREESRDSADRMFAAIERTTRRILAEDTFAFIGMSDDQEGRRLLLGNVARLSELLEHVKESKAAGPRGDDAN